MKNERYSGIVRLEMPRANTAIQGRDPPSRVHSPIARIPRFATNTNVPCVSNLPHHDQSEETLDAPTVVPGFVNHASFPFLESFHLWWWHPRSIAGILAVARPQLVYIT